jgi:hypothetical protein
MFTQNKFKKSFIDLTDEEIKLIKQRSKQVVDTAWDIKEDDDVNEREFKIQYLFEINQRKKNINIEEWKNINYKLLNKKEKKYFNSLCKQLN